MEMGQRWDAARRGRSTLDRAFDAVVRDAAGIAGVALVELLVARQGEGGARWESAAFSAPRLARTRRNELARELARSPAVADLPEPRRRAGHRLAPCEPALARLLGENGLQQVFLPVGGERSVLGWLRVVRDGRPTRAALATYRALARQISGRLEAEALRRELAARHRVTARDVDREKRALATASRAKDTLAALNLAGMHLMVETEAQAIHAVICRELLRIGFHAAVLAREEGMDEPRPRFRWAVSTFSPPLQAAVERVLCVPLSSLRVDPRAAPLVARVLREGRTVHSGQARSAARQLFGGLEAAQLRKLAWLLAFRHVVLAPLRCQGRVAGVLVVARERVHRSDPAAIDAFALQASIALEKARLFSELRLHQARLESEVERRTRELTRAVAALQELDRRKDNFLANVSHELRTPLVTVLGYTDLLLSEKLGPLPAQQREILRVVASSGKRLRSFIDELLELSRWELTRDRLARAPADLGELARQAALSVAPRFEERGAKLRVRTGPRTPLVLADRDRVLQVLTNLLLNAARYVAPGGCVRVAVAGGARGEVAASVVDDGQGIPPEHLQRIFDRLYQVGDAVRPRDRGDGLGLGLAIVKAIVEAHGGSIGVSSRVGRGTRFRFSLPAAGAPPGAPPAAAVREPAITTLPG